MSLFVAIRTLFCVFFTALAHVCLPVEHPGYARVNRSLTDALDGLGATPEGDSP